MPYELLWASTWYNSLSMRMCDVVLIGSKPPVSAGAKV